mmetsp:Transcript_3847/g.9785  ORF Transcript_3847/g.9785 Transcript_3847/m.9785 type:complete len:145 (-) Transcript_3847:1951-2385(-)
MKEKERLVGYDRSAAKQTSVIDDQSDFYEIDSNIWLTTGEKEDLRKREKEREEDNRVYITFDILGRKILSTNEPSDAIHLEEGVGRDGGEFAATASCNAPPGFEDSAVKQTKQTKPKQMQIPTGIPSNPNIKQTPSLRQKKARS